MIYKMKFSKKISAIIMMAALGMSLCACGSSVDSVIGGKPAAETSVSDSADEPKYDVTEPEDTEADTDLPENENTQDTDIDDVEDSDVDDTGVEDGEDIDEEPEVIIDEPVMIDEYNIGCVSYGGLGSEKINEYSHGIAAVEITKGTFDTDMMAVIDEKGDALLTFESGTVSIIEGNILHCDNYDYTYMDRFGNVIFEKKLPEDGKSCFYMGYDNGIFLFNESRSNFSDSALYILAIDLEGNIVSEYEVMEYFIGNMKDRDDGYFIGDMAYYDTYERELRIIPRNVQGVMFSDISPFIGGEALVDIYVPFANLVYNFTEADLRAISEEYNNDNYDPSVGYIYENPNSLYDFTAQHEHIKVGHIDYVGSSVIWFSRESNYYNWSTKEFFNLPDYGEKVYVENLIGYNNGYSMDKMTGADGKKYVTMVDESGNTLYEPVCIDGIDIDAMKNDGKNIYIFSRTTEYYIDENGTLTEQPLFQNISPDINVAGTGSFNNNGNTVFSEGYGFVNNDNNYLEVIKWDEGLCFSTVKITSETIHIG